MELTGLALVVFKNRIVQKFTESNWHDVGLMTGCNDIITSHGRLLRSLSFGDGDYEQCVTEVLQQIIKGHPERTQIILDYLNHLDFPEKTMKTNVSSKELPGKVIVFNPLVFKVPDVDVDKQLLSVMMPFDKSFSPVYSAINTAAAEVGVKCQRADNIWTESEVIQDVFALIYQSFIVVCDFSDKNPNVFYEAGIAHTLGKHVIPIAQHKDHIPFDLRHHRYIEYHNNGEGCKALTTQLSKRISYLVGKTTPESGDMFPVLL